MRRSPLYTTLRVSYNELSSILQSCTKHKALNVGKQLHGMLITNGVDLKIMSFDAKLLGLYASCGHLPYAHQLFDKMAQPNIFAINWMISAMSFHGCFRKALRYFRLVSELSISPNKYTFLMVLKACVGLLDLDKGRQVHVVVNKMGFEWDLLVCNGLIDMYVKCGEMGYARKVFDRMRVRDVASWTSMIAGYSNIGMLNEAIVLFERMKIEGLKPNDFTWNAVIFGYAKTGDRDGALELLSRMNTEGICTDLITWNALISGFARSYKPIEALRLFKEMLVVVGIGPNHVTLTGLLPACGFVGSARIGRELHCLIYRLGLEANVYVASALIDMYSKCGDVRAAKNVFEVVSVRNITVWNSMIGCLGKHGLVDESFELFERMQEQGFQPNEVTFACILSTCSHVGLVEKGMEIFECMKEKYHIYANKEHYACIMDLLCRAGKMEEAYELLRSMPMEPAESIIGAFVNGCKIYQRGDLAKQMVKDLLKTDIKKAGAFVTLSNIFAADEEWEEVEDLRKMMKDKGVYKRPGFSLVDGKYMSVALDIIKDRSNMDRVSEEFPVDDGNRLQEDFITVQGCR